MYTYICPLLFDMFFSLNQHQLGLHVAVSLQQAFLIQFGIMLTEDVQKYGVQTSRRDNPIPFVGTGVPCKIRDKNKDFVLQWRQEIEPSKISRRWTTRQKEDLKLMVRHEEGSARDKECRIVVFPIYYIPVEKEDQELVQLPWGPQQSWVQKKRREQNQQ